MASKKNTVTEEPKRGRGRPSSFPNVDPSDLVSIMTRVPPATQEQFRSIAAARNGGKGENLNITFARLIQQAFDRTAAGKAS